MAKKIEVIRDYVLINCPTCKRKIRIDLSGRGEHEHFYVSCGKCHDNFFAIKNKDLLSIWIFSFEYSAKAMEYEKE